MGLSAAQLLSLARLILFVEGPHDVAVLDEFIGEVLQRNGIVMLPIHGTDNLMGLVESEVLGEFGIRLAVLTDATNPERIREGRPGSDEERAVLRLLQEAEAVGRPIATLGLRRRDIVEYLSEEVCRETARTFPGWSVAVGRWKKAGRPTSFKDWVASKYKLRLDRTSVREYARRTRIAKEIPEEFFQLARDIERTVAEVDGPDAD
jgi:hypothetical protein